MVEMVGQAKVTRNLSKLLERQELQFCDLHGQHFVQDIINPFRAGPSRMGLNLGATTTTQDA